MTNREYLVSLLRGSDRDAFYYLRDVFGCNHISADECMKHGNCIECWKHWLESEVTTNDHA